MLDEYIGLPEWHPETYKQVIRRDVTDRLNIAAANVLEPDGTAPAPDLEASDHEQAIQAGGIGIQILGVGTNGHIGFNEPGCSLGSRTRVKTLLPRTRSDKAAFSNTRETSRITSSLRYQDHHGIPQHNPGGNREAEGRSYSTTGGEPISTICPGSILQLHPRTWVDIDEAAASGLALADYYRYTYENKPAWQL
ncbi:glucosamine-6-phosphate deaminase [Arthrobacter sp. UYEF3]|uniref:glucosamine-6-phosphate deaminase n=1 Tax=Arthrobacter sp. UYEF3 TaxID=1756365 RepID=UPI00339A2B00